MDRFALYENALRMAGLRMTDQRRVVCKWLAHTDQHPTPYQVYEGIAATHPEISRATIYNTLNTLQQLGAIIEINMGADETHYETDPSAHANLICLRCHKVVDFHPHENVANAVQAGSGFLLNPELSTTLGDEIRRATGFQALSAHTDILGLCAECAASGTSFPAGGIS